MGKYTLFLLLLCGVFYQFQCHPGHGKSSPQEHHSPNGVKKQDVLKSVKLRFYSGNSSAEYVDYNLGDSNNLLSHANFTKENTTVFYIHGYKEDGKSESVQTVVSSYLHWSPDVNVVFVDWSKLAGGSYHVNAALNTRIVANSVASQLKTMFDAGLPVDHVHIVGHSLGGQVAGFIGRFLIDEHNTRLRRISALDPAFPLFYPGLLLGHISADDAEFVDVIHTAAGTYGAPVPTGSVDFWPNGGHAVQPGCPALALIPMSPENLCSHWRSWRFWAESVQHPEAFLAAKNSSHGSVGDDSRAYMGISANSSAHGNYHLRTNSESPYGMGEGGIAH